MWRRWRPTPGRCPMWPMPPTAMFACSTDQQKDIKRVIEEHQLNRVIVASCTPRTHEPLFRNTLQGSRAEPLSLRSGQHPRAGFLGASGTNRTPQPTRPKTWCACPCPARGLLEPLHDFAYEVVQQRLGGGRWSGRSDRGSCHSRTGISGHPGGTRGRAGRQRPDALLHRRWRATRPVIVQELIAKVEANPLITVHKNAEVVSTTGSCGNFTTTVVDQRQRSRRLAHGVMIVATGGEEYKPANTSTVRTREW